jgi:hypothetical protein
MPDCRQNYTPCRRENSPFVEGIRSQFLRNSLHFVELEVSLPHLQVSATFPYSDPAQSSPFLPSHLQEIHLNITLPFKPGYSKWTLSLRFRHQKPVCTPPVPRTCYMPRPYNSYSFHHRKNIELTVQIIKLLTMQFSPPCCYLVPLRPNIILSTPFTNTLSQCS